MTDDTNPKPLRRAPARIAASAAAREPPVDGTLIALCVPWEGSPSGCVEWRLVDWTVTDDDGQSFPIWADVAGDTGAWGSDYALRGPQDSDWCFPDGERCDDANLTATFERRRAGASSPPQGEPRPNRRQRRIARARQRRADQQLDEEIEEALEDLEAEGRIRSEIDANGEKRWIAVPVRH